MTRSTLTDMPGERTGGEGPEPGLTLVYSDGLARAGEQVSLAGRVAVLLGRDERLFPGGALSDTRSSGRHAALAHDRGAWRVVDRGSKNGTFVNARRVNEHTLAPGDVIRFGSTFIVFAPIAAHASPAHGDELVGVSAAIAAVQDSISLVARSEHTVLLLGESGTGKEVVARALHRASGRSGPMLAVNCASLRGELLESELFGHVRGAFTGAQRGHDGLFLRAAEGTVFLDEVGEMDEPVQARLLRVLESRTIRPVGASEEIVVATRVVAATNRDVEALVREQRLRTDVYARLARWTITLPPLRERREDLGVLTRSILRRDGDDVDVTPELMAALLEAPWPLNVRGLVNVLTTARIAQPQTARLDLVPHVRSALAAQTHIARVEPAPAAAVELSPERVIDALKAQRGNVAAAARDLGLTRQSLYRLVERLGLDPTSYRG